MRHRAQQMTALMTSDSGVTSIEYALIASLIALVIISAVTIVGTRLASLYDHVKDSVVSALG